MKPLPALLWLLAASPVLAQAIPQVHDDRLQLQVVAEAPQIVTPTGIAVDEQGRVLVIESHTHFRPENYQGPETDRILLMQDFDPATGKARKISTFFEGTKHTMNLAIHPDGSIFVATRAEIFRLWDKDRDGRADERRQRIAHLETAGNYPHNGLSGFAFDFAGNVYFGFGENLGADYKLIASDGQSLAGGGEGGNIYTCDVEGKNLRRLATGFWNPFHLCFDAFGRLFAVDNDPDSRPPCRLLHIVEGGDYGFRFRNGRKGTNPLTAWNGELPGTLPMVCGTGEAPSAILSYESDNLPEEYRGDLLVTSWGDHRIERYRLKPRGASFSGEMTPVVTGGENFRPVGLALAPDGSLYFSDWVDKSYQLHGKGRLWRLSAKEPGKRVDPKDDWAALASLHGPTRRATARRLAAKKPDPSRVKELLERAKGDREKVTLLSTLGVGSAVDTQWLLASGVSAEGSVNLRYAAFQQYAAGEKAHEGFDLSKLPALGIDTVRGPDQDWMLAEPLLHKLPVELASLFLARGQIFSGIRTSWRPDGPNASLIDDARRDPFLLQAAINGARSEMVMLRLKPNQTLKILDHPSRVIRLIGALAARDLDHPSAIDIVPELLLDAEPDLRLVGLRWVAEDDLMQFRPRVEQLLRQPNLTRQTFELALATLDVLSGTRNAPKNEPKGEDFIVKALLDKAASPTLRSYALRSLRADHPQLTEELLAKLASDESSAIRIEAIRTLREKDSAGAGKQLQENAVDQQRSSEERAEAVVGLDASVADERALLIQLASAAQDSLSVEALRNLRGTELTDSERKELGEKLAEVAPPVGHPPAKDVAAWLKYAEGEGDAVVGERLFFHGKIAACARCHEFEGRGQQVGPDLTTIGRTLTRERLVQSIVDPSREIAPQFTPFVIATTDGNVKTGTYVGEEVDGTVRYADATGQIFKIHPRDIEQRKPSPVSVMPDNLAQQMTQQELRDLLAFLLGERGASAP